MQLPEPSNALTVQPFLDGDLRTIRAAGPTQVRVRGDRLEWTPWSPECEARMPPREPVERCLAEFCEVASAPSADNVLAFVRRFGVFDLAVGGMPACSPHYVGGAPQLAEAWDGTLRTPDPSDPLVVCWEPVAAYVAYAQSARTIRALASALHGSDVDPFDVVKREGFPITLPTAAINSAGRRAVDSWEAQITSTTGTLPPVLGQRTHMLGYAPDMHAEHLWSRHLDGPRRPSVQAMRRRLAGLFQQGWIEPSGLVPVLDWTEDRPRFGLAVQDMFNQTPPLFRVVALQLAAAMMDTEHAFTCTNCGTKGFRGRRPRADVAVLCDTCRDQATAIRMRRYRARKRGQA